MLKLQNFHQWLNRSVTCLGESYRHQILNEDSRFRPIIINDIRELVHAAHEDTRRHLRRVAGISLDPLEGDDDSIVDPAQKYPQCFHIQNLKAFFGEILAGVVAENCEPFGQNGWQVPAFLFRFSVGDLQYLDAIHQIDQKAKIRPGRLGDDCLAFIRDEEGHIILSLVCEAKCTADHDATMVADAHSKVSEPYPKPVDLLRLIEILLDYDDPNSKQWVMSLRELNLKKNGDICERRDLVSYAYGRCPVKNHTWLPTDAPHPKYTGGRALEAVEIHFENVEELVREAYCVDEG